MKKIILFGVMLVLLFNVVSAFDWDNVKSYNSTTKTVTVKNAFGLPLISSNLAEITLNTPQVYRVGLGYQKVAEIEFNSEIAFKHYLINNNFEFYDLNNDNKKINRNLDFKYKTTREYLVNDYTCAEVIGKNGTLGNQCVVTGNHIEQKEDWRSINELSFVKGEKIVIGVFTDVKLGDRIEWIPTFYGIKINEWAEWTGDLGTSLEAYWNFDDVDSYLPDVTGNNTNLSNLSSGGFPQNTTGIINSGQKLKDGASENGFGGDNHTSIRDLNDDFTFNFWYRVDNVPGATNPYLFTNGNDGWGVLYKGATQTLTLAKAGVALFGNENCTTTTGSYDMITFIVDQPNFQLYRNGTLCDAGATGVTFVSDGVEQGFAIWTAENGMNVSFDEVGLWSRVLNSSEVTQLWNGGAGITFPIQQDLSINLLSPNNNTNFLTNLVNFSANVSEGDSTTVQNATIMVNFTNGTIAYSNTNTTGISDIYYWNITLPNINANYNWTVYAYGDDGVQYNASNGTLTFSVNSSRTNEIFYNNVTYETANETFVTNITTNGTAPTNAFLVYGSTTTSATITNNNDNDYNITSFLLIPTGNLGDNQFYFNYSVGGVESTTNSTQTKAALNFTMNSSGTACDTGFLPYLNFSFADEANSTVLTGTLNTFSATYWLADSSTNKTLSTSNATANYNYLFCTSPQNQTLYVDLSTQYEAEGYPARNFAYTNQSLTSDITNETLYLLASGDGIYVTFQVVDAANQVLGGVDSNITYSGSVVGAGTTGGDGLITYWLNPDSTYTASFSKTGYPSYTTTQQFTQTSYTVQLGQTNTSNATDYQQGITYSVLPNTLTYLDNDTIYNFNFTINSIYWSLERFGFNITDEDGNLFTSTSNTSGTGGVALSNLNTSGNDSLIMNAYWTINSTNTTLVVSWLILDVSGNSFSISNLFTNFITYTSEGLFGLDSFGIGIICFLIIVITTGALKMKVGISNTAAVIGVMWALVALLDVSLGLIPNPVGAITNFPTMLMGLLFAAVMFKEVLQ